MSSACGYKARRETDFADEQGRNADRRWSESDDGNAATPAASRTGDQIIYGGEACGYVLEFSNGVKMYHAGDTNVLATWQSFATCTHRKSSCCDWRPLHHVAREAAYACKLLKPETVVPMHFGTFPLLTGHQASSRNLRPK